MHVWNYIIDQPFMPNQSPHYIEKPSALFITRNLNLFHFHSNFDVKTSSFIHLFRVNRLLFLLQLFYAEYLLIPLVR